MNKEIAPVLAEVATILKKHDMVGLVAVGNKTHCDWLMKVDASWSCAWLEETPEGHLLRLKAKRADFPSLEVQKLCLDTTVGTFVTFKDTLATWDKQLEKILVAISRSVDFLGKSTDET